MLKIAVHLPGEMSFEREFREGPILVGRGQQANLLVPDLSVSRLHARFIEKEAQWFVEDLGSRNGIFRRGVRLQGPTPVTTGDRLQLGAATLELRLVAPPAILGEEKLPKTTTFLPMGKRLLKGAGEVDLPALGDDPVVLRRYAERLLALNRVHQALVSSMSLEELLDLILATVFQELNPEEAAIFLCAGDMNFHCVASRGFPGVPPVYSRTLFRQVVEKRMAALVLDAQAEAGLTSGDSLRLAGLRSILAVPLMDEEDLLGLIVVASRLSVHHFSSEDLEILAPLATVAAMRIRNVRLTQEALDRRRLEEEVALARQIQVALFPEDLPAIKGLELYAGNLPSRGVSGDLYQLSKVGENLVGFVADVAGKGIGAALLTASLEALLAPFLVDDAPLPFVMQRVSLLLHQRTPPDKFATAVLFRFNPEDRQLTYCNAGHCLPIWLPAKGKTQFLPSTGIPLGILPEAAYEEGKITLTPGDVIVLYTDGFCEAQNPQGQEYSHQRLAATLEALREKTLPAMAAGLEKDLAAFTQGLPPEDDRTLLMLRVVA